MQREKFIEVYNDMPDEINRRTIKQRLHEMVASSTLEDIPNVHPNLIVVMEELSELQKEVAKYIRGKRDRIGMIEEMADVLIAIMYLQDICGIETTELYKAMNVKDNRISRILSLKNAWKEDASK